MTQSSQISIAISADTLQRLIRNGELCLRDMTCLNKHSKQALQQCFLKSVMSQQKNG